MWHGAEMAVTMICIGMPVCRPAVSSMLQVCGLVPRKPSTSMRSKDLASNNNNNHNKTPTSSSYIRNFGGGTWEEAVGCGPDVDSWSQRRILGVGDATSNATSTSTSSSSGISAKEAEAVNMIGVDSGGVGYDVYPMAALSKTGITVTKTVDITKDERPFR